MTQLLEEDEVSKYQEGKGVLFGTKAKTTMAKASKPLRNQRIRQTTLKKCKGCSRSGHVESSCWKLHPELRPKRSRGHQKQASQASLDNTEELTAMPRPQYVAIAEGASVQLKPSHYTVAREIKNQRIWIYDTGASTHVTTCPSLKTSTKSTIA
jgi:hypothetical protein